MQENDNNLENAESAIKQRLGQVGRSMKKLDLRKQIVDYPFPAVGIAVALGAIVGAVRPKPQPSRLGGLIVTTLGAIGFRLIREAAVKELGTYAKNYIMNKKDDTESSSFHGGSQGVEGGNVRYTPAL